MSTPFQNRLVGTIIVSAAIIIFLPDILDGEKKSYQADFEEISAAPAFEKKQINKAFPHKKLTSLPKKEFSSESAVDDYPQVDVDKTSKTVNQLDNSNIKIAVLSKNKTIVTNNEPKRSDKNKASTAQHTVKSKQLKKQPEKAKLNRAWVIHLGSFRHKQNVKELLEKLKKNGYTAYTRPIKTKNGYLTKVFVGPELIKSSLDKKLTKLKKLTNVQGKVARYQANN